MKPEQFLEHLSSHLKHTIAGAIAAATKLRSESVTPLHLLYALTQEHGSVGKEILLRIKTNPDEIYTLLSERAPHGTYTSIPSAAVIPELSVTAKKILERAMLTAYEQGHQYVGTEHLLYGLIEEPDTLPDDMLPLQKKIRIELEAIFESMNKFPDMDEVKDALEHMQDMVAPSHDHDHDHPGQPAKTGKPSKKNTRSQTALDVFTTNLTNKDFQKNIDPVIGREPEIERLIHILCRRTKNNPVLVGEPGVGKTAIVEGLAKKIALGDVPDILKRKKIISLDLTLLIAGTIYRGEFESRLKQIIDEITQSPDTIVFIDEIHNIIGAGSNQGTMDAANILKPALARGQLHCIGATTLDEYKKHISSDPALERRFQSIRVDEPSRDQTIAIITGIKKYYEHFHHVQITQSAVETAVDMSMKYIHDNFLPDKAIDLIDEASAAVRVAQKTSPQELAHQELTKELHTVTTTKETAIHNESFAEAIAAKKKETRLKRKLATLAKALAADAPIAPDATVSAEQVIAVVSRRLGIAESHLAKTEWEGLIRLGRALKEQIIGQDYAIDTVVSGLKRAAVHVGADRRPLASFLFAGPSGVGKTALAKTLATELYHTDKALIRFDMSEFGEAHSLSKLLGSPAGYIGYRERNRFTEALREHPYAVILFDEFDKAHPDVQKILLQILDEGELTDSIGKKISFTHSIIILTSNIGSELYGRQALGFGSSTDATPERQTRTIQAKIKEHFGQPLTARIGAIIPFLPLDPTALATITTNHIAAISTNLLARHGFSITPDTQVVKTLIARSHTTESGARDISRIVDTVIADAVADIQGKRTTKKTYRLTEQAGEFLLT